MDANKILQADILDIVFEGRNKVYGAYELRRSYRKRLALAISIMLLLCLLMFAVALLANGKKKVQSSIIVEPINLENIKEKKDEPPPQVQPPKKIEIPKIAMTKLTTITPVKDEDVKEPPPDQDKLADTKIGLINQDGIKDPNIVAPPVEVKGTGVVDAPKVKAEDYDGEFKTVQIEAKFPGGIEAWRKYLERNLNRDLPVENGAPTPAEYKVYVSFLVDKEGNISEVKAENNPGYGTAEEAVRVIKKGPKWIAAEQNGRNVIYRQRQTIIFKLDEQ